MRQYNFTHDNKEKGKGSVTISNQKKYRFEIIPIIICIFIAIGIWIYCVNMTEADRTKEFTVKIETIGEMQDGMQTFIRPEAETVTLTVKGTNVDMQKFTAADFRAYIDISEIDAVGWKNLAIKTELPAKADGTTLTIDKINIDQVSVYVDVEFEKDVPIQIKEAPKFKYTSVSYEIIGAKLKEDGKSYIAVKGPKTIVESIKLAEYSIESVESSMEIPGSSLPLRLYDNNDILIQNATNEKGDISTFITYDTTNIKINVDVIAEKLVELKVNPSNPELNFDYITNVAQVMILGDPAVLQNINTVTVNVVATEIGTIDLTLTPESLKLPEGVTLKEETVDITVTVSEKSST